MNDAFVLKGRLELDASDFNDELDAAKEKAKTFGDSVDKDAGSANSTLKNTLSVAGGQLLSKIVTEAWEAAKEFAKESITVASNLAEVQNVVDVTFGDGAAEINVWANNALEAFGMSEYSAKKYASTMGAMFKSFGMTTDAAQDMSTGVVSLASDMASFYNMDHEEIMTKIRAGFAGEIEPLRQLGINMSVANLEAYALSKGMDKAWSSMSQAEQAQLRYNYLLDATADSQGDFSRTSGNYANQMKILEGHLQEVSATFGTALINVVTPAIQQLNEWLAGNQLIEIQKNQEQEEKQINLDYTTAESIIKDLDSMQTEFGDAVYETDAWKASIKALAEVMPELGQYIDINTGKIKGNTDELLEHAKAIRDVKLLNAAERTLSSYNSVVESRYNELFATETALVIARNRHKGLTDPANAIMEMLGDRVGGDNMITVFKNINDGLLSTYAQDQEIYNQIIASDAYKTLFSIDNNGDSQANLALQYMQEEEELERQLEDNLAAYNESVDAAEQAKEAVDKLTNANTTAAAEQDVFSTSLTNQQAALTSVGEAAAKLTEYYKGLKEAAHGALESVAGSLSEKIEYEPVDLVEIGGAIDDDNTTLSLYAKNLEEAKNAGMDADLLAYLADGSAENMAILDAWVNGGDEARNTFNEQFKGYMNAKEAAATQMADAQAAVDEEYQALQTDLEEMVNAFNKEEAIAAELVENNAAVTAGFSDIIASVSQGVQGINNALAGLPGSFSLNFTYGNTSGDNPATNAKGLGYVPYDNYLTYLHKGESVLSRVEAENWRKGANNASAGIDYDRLAAVLASNMAGMTMQMDGKMIGALIAPVVSRNIEKEAWRGRY